MEILSKIDELVSKGKIKKATISKEMYEKEFSISWKDLDAARKSFDIENYKWATIQAYYAIFHAFRALLFKSGFREESHAALKNAIKELFIETGVLDKKIYTVFERGMDLREMADYKESYSRGGAETLLKNVEPAIKEIENEIFK